MLKKLFKLIALTALMASVAQGGQTPIVSNAQVLTGALAPRNYVTNPTPIAIGTRGWTSSGGTFQRDTTSGYQIDGVASFSYDASASSDYVESAAWTFSDDLKNGNCAASVKIKGDASLYSLKIIQGSNTVLTQALSTYSDFQTVTANFICGDNSTSTKIRIEATGNGAQINFGKVYGGSADGFNLQQVNQASFYGAMTQGGGTSCLFLENTSTAENNYVSLGTAASCASSWSSEGAVTAPAATDYKPTLNNMPPGDYAVSISGFFLTNTANQICDYKISDGTNTFGYLAGYSSTTSAASGPLVGRISYTGAASRTFSIVASDNSTGACEVVNDAAGRQTVWSFYRYPLTTEIVHRSDQGNWKVDANISGANPVLGTTGSISSWTGITDTGLTLANNSGTGNVTAQIPCSSTNAPTGTTCSSGSESVGVSFTPTGPFPQDVKACAQFSTVYQTGSTVTIDQVYSIQETASNAQTSIQDGHEHVPKYMGSSDVEVAPFKVCGTFTFSSAGQRTLRLMYQQSIANTMTQNSLIADTAVGGRDVHWTVEPIQGSTKTPVYVGSVTSNSAGSINETSAIVASTCSASPCTIAWQDNADIGTITRTGTGVYSVNHRTGAWSSTPSCFVQLGSSCGDCHTKYNGTPDATAFAFTVLNSSGTNTDDTFNVFCRGPK